jgi:Holliday junction DNA helicase RuvB
MLGMPGWTHLGLSPPASFAIQPDLLSGSEP